MTKIITKGYSLWYVPEGHVYERMRDIIRDLSERYGGPLFEPHVTLVSGFMGPENDAIAKSEQIAGKIKPFTIGVKGMGYLNDIFRSMFLRVEQGDGVVKAYQDSCRILNIPERMDWWFPHLSLFYGNLPGETKKRVATELGETEFGFGVDRIHLYDSNSAIDDWKKIKEFRLG